MIELVIEERRRNIGAFEVGRVLLLAKRRMVGRFIFLDQPPCTHRGLAVRRPDRHARRLTPASTPFGESLIVRSTASAAYVLKTDSRNF